uniref:4HB_MCP_1 domain-containing protein n=1 Tax=Steinernema glaseri TaxID=37863 RepID=A0A1I7ZTL2_9BILA
MDEKEARARFVANAGLILAAIVAIIGSYTFVSYMAYDDISKPSDTNAYLDKAFFYHERDLLHFNYKLRQWIRGEERDKSRDTASEKLNGLIKDAEALQRKLSGGENYDDLKESALIQVHLTQKQDNSSDEAMSAIERYLKAVNMDRAYSLQKFLVDYIAHPKKNTVATLDNALLQIDQKVDELKKQTHAEYHDSIDTFWSDLKQKNTPGILKSCLPVDAGAEIIREAYTTMIDLRVAECVPIGEEKWVVDFDTLAEIFGIMLLLFSFPMMLPSKGCLYSTYPKG